jgi:hypothetical protein
MSAVPLNGVKRLPTRSERAEWKLPAGLEERAVCAVDLIADARKPPTFVIDHLAEAGDVVLLAGAEKVSFKTWLALNLAIARIIGRDWLGFEVQSGKPQRVLFISTETRGTVLVRRHLAVCGTEIDAAVAAKYLYIIDEPVTLVSVAERERVRAKAEGETRLAALRTFSDEQRATLRASAENVGAWAANSLGTNVDLLDSIAVPDTWSLIIIDTLRQCLDGEENNSQDAARFIAAARELARTCGCVVVIVHHTNKTGAAGEARSSRGSGEITAGPDVIASIDPTGEYPTVHFLIRNHAPVDPVGYNVVTEGEGVRLDVLPPCAGKSKDLIADDVLEIFRAHPNDGLTVSTLRKLIAKARGGKPGAKANAKAVERQLTALEKRGAISRCEIVTGKGAKAIDGYRLGASGGKLPLRRFDVEGRKDTGDLTEWLGDPSDV